MGAQQLCLRSRGFSLRSATASVPCTLFEVNAIKTLGVPSILSTLPRTKTSRVPGCGAGGSRVGFLWNVLKKEQRVRCQVLRRPAV